MASTKKKSNMLKYVKILAYGIIFSIVAYVLSGDASSIALGLLVMYLENKFSKGE
jgi:hypothetical protein